MNRCALMLAVALIGSSAHAQLITVEWDVGGRFERTIPVPAAKFIEMCEKLGAGTRVQWHFDAPSPLDFNIHYHQGKEVRFPARAEQSRGSQGTLAVASEQDYCWMWTNKTSASVSVSVKLERGR